LPSEVFLQIVHESIPVETTPTSSNETHKNWTFVLTIYLGTKGIKDLYILYNNGNSKKLYLASYSHKTPVSTGWSGFTGSCSLGTIEGPIKRWLTPSRLGVG
jgi:hypothetical protein